MNEVEKLYSLAGVEGEILRGCFDYYSFKGIDIWTVANCKDTDCKNCKYNKFIKHTPPFTAEKQLELIKWLMNNPKDFFSWTIQQQGKDVKYAFYVGYEYGGSEFLEFTEALADILNDLWQDLTEEERKQIKEILE